MVEGRNKTRDCSKGPSINLTDQEHNLDSCIKYQFIGLQSGIVPWFEEIS